MMKKEKMCLLGLLPALTVPMTLPCLAGNLSSTYKCNFLGADNKQ